MDDGTDELREEIDELKQIVASQQETIDELENQSLFGQWSRRGVLGSIAVALGLASASGSAAAGVGDVGTPSERVDAFIDQADVNALEATGMTIVQAVRKSGADLSLPSDTYANIVNSDILDEQNEFDNNGNARFIPNKSGLYKADFQVQFFNATDGDKIEMRVRDIDAGSNVSFTSFIEDTWSSGNDYTHRSCLIDATAGNQIEFQAKNSDNSASIGSESSWLHIVRIPQQR